MGRRPTCYLATTTPPAAFLAGVPSIQDGWHMRRHPVENQRPTLDEYHHDGRAGGHHGLQQLLLQAQQVEGGAVVAFTTFHVAKLRPVRRARHGGRARGLVFSLKIAGAGAAQHHHGHLRLAGRRHGRRDVGTAAVADGAAPGIQDLRSRPNLGPNAG
jgi:hypothetical protein